MIKSRLPIEIIRKIFEYDDSYKIIFKKIIEQLITKNKYKVVIISLKNRNYFTKLILTHILLI
jgi:hypothetical protein